MKTDRKTEILRGGLKAAEERGYTRVTKDDVAFYTEGSASLIQYYFKTMKELRDGIIRQAIADKNLMVLAQALGSLDEVALQAPARLKNETLRFIKENGMRVRLTDATTTTPRKLYDRVDEFITE